MSNVRDVIEGRLPRSLAYVFEQLAAMGVKQQGQYQRPVPKPLTVEERNAIGTQLRRDLEASLKLCQAPPHGEGEA